MSKHILKKVVHAYSGGLDTSGIVSWLKENYGCEVVCFAADVGQRYFVVSPDLPFSNGVTLDHERTYSEHHYNLKARVYLAYGEKELNDYTLPYLTPFVKALEERKYPGLTLIQQTIANCDHCAVGAPVIQAGLVAVYSQRA